MSHSREKSREAVKKNDAGRAVLSVGWTGLGKSPRGRERIGNKSTRRDTAPGKRRRNITGALTGPVRGNMGRPVARLVLSLKEGPGGRKSCRKKKDRPAWTH